MAQPTLLIMVNNLTVTTPGGLILDHARAIQNHGINVAILTGGGRLVRQARKLGLKVIIRDLPSISVLDVFAARRLARDMRIEGTRFVHAFGLSIANLASYIAEKCQCPWLLELYSARETEQPPPLVGHSLRSIVVPSTELRTHLVARHQVPKDLVRVIPPGVWVAGSSLKIAEDSQKTPVIGTFGPFLRRGSHDHLLHAIQHLKSQEIATQCVFVGEGEALTEYWHKAAQLGILDCTNFVGDLPSRAAIFELLDVYVDCSPDDADRHDLHEAMARGLLSLCCRQQRNELMPTKAGQDESATLTKIRESDELKQPEKLGLLLAELLQLDASQRQLMSLSARHDATVNNPLAKRIHAFLDIYQASGENVWPTGRSNQSNQEISRRWTRSTLIKRLN